MDTKPIEQEALNHIQSLVARYGYKYANLNFDKKGGDFFIIEEAGEFVLKFLTCQSKGRCVYPDGSNVRINQDYVEDNFLVFVYVKPENVDETQTYLYTAEDIKTVWGKTGHYYYLCLQKDFNSIKTNEKYLLNKERAQLIGRLLANFGRCKRDEIVLSISDSDFYYDMWQKTGGLPCIEYIRSVFADEELSFMLSTGKFIFLLCASILQNNMSDYSLSIDWAFLYLKGFNYKDINVERFREGNKCFSDVAIAYSRTWVNDLLSNEGEQIGFHLHIGDSEESIDAYVLKDGDYSISYVSSKDD